MLLPVRNWRPLALLRSRPRIHGSIALNYSRSRVLQSRLLTSGLPPSAPSRADRVIAKLPRFLQPYATPLLQRPASHLTAFLILHELTAVIPLFAFFYLFQVTSWNPADLLPSEWINSGYERFKKYVEKRGLQKWIDGRGIMDLATAYAVVKGLVPVRVLVSIWGAPWFARVAVIPVTAVFRRLIPGAKPKA